MLVGDVEQMDPLPLPARHFDCVIFGDTLEHLKEPEALLRRLRRHVKRDGLLIANVPNIAHWSVIVELLQGRFPYAEAGLLDRTHLRFFTPESVE
ncbi:MAG: methyltransferase domain-containing protein, partial [Fimbriimonas ginsengisoli]|nr:methyltransferase domain-containing protein [Fimbriimonas ginsengisoli]